MEGWFKQWHLSMIMACALFLPHPLTLPGVEIFGQAAAGTEVYRWSTEAIPVSEGGLVGDAWTCLWLGFGTGTEFDGQLWLEPLSPIEPVETHSALVRSNFPLGEDWDISVWVVTGEQLRVRKNGRRTFTDPNPWEVAWLMANMTDDGSAGLYLVFKTNGVELGAYRYHGAEQVFLHTQASPELVVGHPYLYRFIKQQDRIFAYVNDGSTEWQIGNASLTPVEGWQFGNKLGLYTEDAAVRFGEVWVKSDQSSALTISILSPTGATAFASGDMIFFEGLSNSSDGSDLSSEITWTSNLEGLIGTGNSFVKVVQDGEHVITASATDLDGMVVTDSVEVTVGYPPVGENVVSLGSIHYSTLGGKHGDSHLLVQMSLSDTPGNFIPGATLMIELYRGGELVWLTSAVTDQTGYAKFKLNNAPVGCYSVTITSVDAAGAGTWDGIIPENSFCKSSRLLSRSLR